MPANYSGQNINRVNAVKQLSKGLKRDSDLEILGSIANAFVYIGDVLDKINVTMEKQNKIINEQGVRG